jgi:hypothetical protein
MKNALLFRVSIVLLAVAPFGCYQMSSTRVPVQSPTSPVGCIDLADRVFFSAGYTRLTGSSDALVYAPRVSPAAEGLSPIPFQWGIGVWKPEQSTWSEGPGACAYELQAVSTDPTCDMGCPPPPTPVSVGGGGTREPIAGPLRCGLQCPLTPQPGTEFDQATREMAERLRAAGAVSASSSGAAPTAMQ